MQAKPVGAGFGKGVEHVVAWLGVENGSGQSTSYRGIVEWVRRVAVVRVEKDLVLTGPPHHEVDEGVLLSASSKASSAARITELATSATR